MFGSIALLATVLIRMQAHHMWMREKMLSDCRKLNGSLAHKRGRLVQCCIFSTFHPIALWR